MADVTGKAKRGVAGQTNARNNPFRLNGWPPDWQARRIGAHRGPMAISSGSRLMRGLVGGALAQLLGYGDLHGDYERAFEHAQKRVTHPLLRMDESL